MKALILLLIILWLGVCIPQNVYLWAAITSDAPAFDRVAAIGRAILLDFLPLLSMWMEGMLHIAHEEETDKEYKKYERRWEKRRTKSIQQAPLETREEFGEHFLSTAHKLRSWIPRMFLALVVVIALSYLGYYEEYGKHLQIYDLTWDLEPLVSLVAGVPSGPIILPIGSFIKVVIMLVRLSISAIVTFVLGRMAAIVGVQDVPNDVANFLAGVKDFALSLSSGGQPATKKGKLARRSTEGKEDWGGIVKAFYRENPTGSLKALSAQHDVSEETLRRARQKLLEKDKTFIKVARGEYLVKEDAGEEAAATPALPPKYQQGDE